MPYLRARWGKDNPIFDDQPVATFLTMQWNTIKVNLKAGPDQVCVGGFIFDWCDEYWKGNNNSVQLGGPDGSFKGGAFAGSYYDEAGFGVASAVDQSAYGQGKPNISRTLFKGYNAVKAFYNASSESGDELYLSGAQFGAIQSDIQEEIHQDRKQLKQLREIDVAHEASVRRWLQVEIAALHARQAHPTDEVLMQLDEMLDTRTSLSKSGKRHVLQQLRARLDELGD